MLCALFAACSVKKSPRTPSDYAAKDVLVDHQSFDLPSNRLGGVRKIAVYLPPQYAAEPTRHFPVLFLPDGGVKQDFPHVSFTIDSLIAKKLIPPMLVVGVESQDRYRELTSPAKGRRWKKKLPQAGGATPFHEFFEFELKPEIAKRFRVKGMPCALIGESLAGRWVVEGWTQNPERYDLWIAIDPSLWWNDDELLNSLGSRLGELSAHKATRLYLSGAYRNTRGSLPDVHAFVRRLDELSIASPQVTFESYPNLHHVEIFRSTENHIYQEMFKAWATLR